MGTSKQRPRRVRKAASTRASSASMADCRENRHALIAEAACFKSERRSFVPGHELDDWLQAEHEVDQRPFGEGR
jgi:Protein of unknown function (DUF2934)